MKVLDTPWRARALVIRGFAEDVDADAWFTEEELAQAAPDGLRLQRSNGIL